MSAPISNFVKVSISRNTSNVSAVGFGTAMILSGEAKFPERLRYFSGDDLASLAAALHGGSAAKAYKAAQNLFAANPKPSRVAIGHRGATIVITDNAGTFTAGSISAKINGVVVSTNFTSTKAATLGAFATAIDAVTGVESAVYDDTGHTITLTPSAGTVLGVELLSVAGVTGTMTMTTAATESEAVNTALDAISLYQPDWYAFGMISRLDADILLAAAWAEAAVKKIFGTASAVANIVDTTVAADTTTIAAQLKALGYLKTFIFYHAAAATEYPEFALFGKILPLVVGSYNAMYMTLAGITAGNLTTTQRLNAVGDGINSISGKNVNVYEYAGGKNIVHDGVVCSGEYIDVVIFIDWLDARCGEAVFALLASQPKVPYTDGGIQAIASALEAPLREGLDNGGISPKAFNDNKEQIGGYIITVPRLQDVSSTDKSGRVLNNVKFKAFLAGAVNFVAIDGTVTY